MGFLSESPRPGHSGSLAVERAPGPSGIAWFGHPPRGAGPATHEAMALCGHASRRNVDCRVSHACSKPQADEVASFSWNRVSAPRPGSGPIWSLLKRARSATRKHQLRNLSSPGPSFCSRICQPSYSRNRVRVAAGSFRGFYCGRDHARDPRNLRSSCHRKAWCRVWATAPAERICYQG
jgi:hypothetical protein